MPIKHLARLLTILALLLAPIGMLGTHAAMAAPAPEAAGGHCADMSGSSEDAPEDATPASAADCMIACACVPAKGAELNQTPAPKTPATARPIQAVIGSNPTADPPPPRLS